jgi:hypothetical protein
VRALGVWELSVKESSHVSPRSSPAMLGAGSGVAATNVFATLHKTNLKSESTRNRIRTYRCRVANAAALDSACQQGRSFPLLFVKMDWDEWAGKARLLGNTFSSLPSMDIHIQKPFIATPGHPGAQNPDAPARRRQRGRRSGAAASPDGAELGLGVKGVHRAAIIDDRRRLGVS